MRPYPLVLFPVLALALVAGSAQAGDLKIPLPKRDITTPVQKLNREGVKAAKKHKLEKARKLFYRAYLLDPNDPFTLNNLGYISELSGNIERAERYYQLAAENTSDATIAAATDKDYKGKKISQVAGHAGDEQMQINRYNVQAMGLLLKGRAPEADMVLQKALKLDPNNPFTLNNMGYAKEKEGEYERAFADYSRAANTGSDARIVVAVNEHWRGKKIGQVAEDNARALQKLMRKENTPEAMVARLNLQGVSAINRNDRETARKDFERAYKLAPENSFTLNNMGYLAEMDGDRETAAYYYEKAREAQQNNVIAAVATRREVEGKPVSAVATFGDNVVTTRMAAIREERRAEGGPVVLHRRDGSVVVDPNKPPPPINEDEEENNAPPSNPSTVVPPLPENQQPPATGQSTTSQPAANPGSVMPPLPENQQPPATSQPATNPGEVVPPLPEKQQPPATSQPTAPQPEPKVPAKPEPIGNPDQNNSAPPHQQQPNQQPPAAQPPTAQPTPKAQTTTPQQKQGAVVDGLIMPLPDNQQPATKTPPKQ